MTTPEPDKERRAAPRVERIQLVEISRFDEEGIYSDLATGRTLNLSRSGARLEFHHSLPLRSTVELSIVLGDAVVQVTGRVVYLEAIDDERTAMGVTFTDLPPGAREALDGFLATLPPQTAE